MKVKFSYLAQQFADVDDYLSEMKKLVQSGDFTLGAPLVEFEERFAKLCEVPYAIGVASGTDALVLSLRALGIGPGDEVITTPTTFVATVGAIVTAGANPVFVDSENGFVIDPEKIEAAITTRTKAIMPVHYTGNMADMPAINEIARKHNLAVVEDACQAIAATINGKPTGCWGDTACFSLHPLKNLNVWGDGGIIVTRNKDFYEKLRLNRNHGLINRDQVAEFGCNSRLDTLQAVIGNKLIEQIDFITNRRIENARAYDNAFSEMKDCVSVPIRRPGVKHVFHLYIVRVKHRNQLIKFLQDKEIEARIHYPVPLHLQEAARYLGYKKGDFPVCEADCDSIITLPSHQHLDDEQISYVINSVREYYEI